MEKVITDQIEFVRTLCLKRNKHSAKQWANLSVRERTDVAQAVQSDFIDDIYSLEEDLYAWPWCAHFVDSLLSAEGLTPKLVVVKNPVCEIEQKSDTKPLTLLFRKCFDNAHSTASDKATSLAKLLFFNAVRRFGHLHVEYVTKFYKRVSHRSNDVYGNPRMSRVKVRVVDAIRDVSLSRKFYAAGPSVWEEADLTIIFARNFPSVPVGQVTLYLYQIVKISDVYKLRRP